MNIEGAPGARQVKRSMKQDQRALGLKKYAQKYDVDVTQGVAESDKDIKPSAHTTPCAASPRTAEDRLIAALQVVLVGIGPKQERWLTSTRQLRAVSLQVCNTCRHSLPARVCVERKTPRSVWASSPPEEDFDLDDREEGNTNLRAATGRRRRCRQEPRPVGSWPRRTRRSHLLGIPAFSVVWDLPVRDLPLATEFLKDVKHLKFGFHFDEPLHRDLRWPAALSVLDLGARFGQDISEARWPRGLRELRLGACFDRAIQGVTFPEGLERIVFGTSFNKPIDGVVWPASLSSLEFGRNFDQPLNNATLSWPASLEILCFGRNFSHDLGPRKPTPEAHAQDSWWPASLRQLTLEEGFRQPLHTVAWPQGLESLTLSRVKMWCPGELSACCATTWPPRLRCLSLDFDAHHSVAGVLLPPGLIELVFGDHFNQSISGMRWPPQLRRLIFGASFNHSIDGVTFPSELASLEFGHRFNQNLGGVAWPVTLERLVFRDHFDQPMREDVLLPAQLKTLEFGRCFNRCLAGVLPPCLFRLVLGKDFDRPAACVRIPRQLMELTLADGCKQNLQGISWPQKIRFINVGYGCSTPIDRKVLGLPETCVIRRAQL